MNVPLVQHHGIGEDPVIQLMLGCEPFRYQDWGQKETDYMVAIHQLPLRL